MTVPFYYRQSKTTMGDKMDFTFICKSSNVEEVLILNIVEEHVISDG